MAKRPPPNPFRDPGKGVGRATCDKVDLPPKKLASLTEQLHALTESLDVNPFKILLHMAAGDARALGLAPDERVSLGIRYKAAAETCKYLYPQISSITLSNPDGTPFEAKLTIVDELAEMIIQTKTAMYQQQKGSGNAGGV